MPTKQFSFKTSKLSSTADQLWSASKSGFKANEKSVKLDLGKTLVKSDDSSVKGKNDNEKLPCASTSNGFIFGSRLTERVIVDKNVKASKNNNIKEGSNDEISETAHSIPKTVSDVFEAIKKKGVISSSMKTSNLDDKEDGEDAASSSLTFLKNSRSHLSVITEPSLLPKENKEIEITTGEEDEENILNVTCKLHTFDSSTNSWVERGLTSLRINRRSDSTPHTYRIVGRVTGNQRVVVNSKIFPNMVVERVSSKRVKFSGTVPDSDVPALFLITASEFTAEQFYSLLSSLAKDVKSDVTKKRKADSLSAEGGDGTSASKRIAT